MRQLTLLPKPRVDPGSPVSSPTGITLLFAACEYIVTPTVPTPRCTWESGNPLVLNTRKSFPVAFGEALTFNWPVNALKSPAISQRTYDTTRLKTPAPV